jgi:predicted amidohydrolase YtcJ
MPLDLLVIGRIATLAGASGFGWVEAVGITDGRVAFAGSAVDLETRADPHTRRIELEPDEVALPGLSDAHLHLAEGGLSTEHVDLTATRTLDEALERIAAAHAELDDEAWLEGHGWHVDRWGVWPTAADLDRVAPGRRAALWAHDHHALWSSSAGLAAAGIDADSADPAGGIIRRDERGAPTGVLHESAARLVVDRVPPPEPERYERLIDKLARELVRLGVVAIHDPGALSLQQGLGRAIKAYRALDERDALPLRVHASIREEQLGPAGEAGLHSGDPLGPPGGRARFGWLKLFADGTLASRTAALLEPIEAGEQAGLPPGTERGIWLTPPERLAELAGQAADQGITTQVHAIGDRAVRATLDALEPTAGRTHHMPRLEHIQLLDPADVPRFARSGIAASVQPVHLRADAASAHRLWGDRAESNGYPLRSLLGSGAVLAFGTDAPVEPIDPWPGLSMAVCRRDVTWGQDSLPFGSQEAIRLDEAFRAACIAPAVTAAEDDRGRLVPGQRADLIVVPAAVVDDPVEPGGALATARPRLVLIDGVVEFET